MEQVKVFCVSDQAIGKDAGESQEQAAILTEKINEWLAANPGISIIERKMDTTSIAFNLSNGKAAYYFYITVMISYRDKNLSLKKKKQVA